MRQKSQIDETVYRGITLHRIGEIPSEKCIFFYFGKGGSERSLASVYISALEALLSGYSICYIPQLYLSRAVEKAARDTLTGSVYAFFPKGLGNVSPSLLSLPLISGGGAVSIVENDAFFSYEALLGISYVASEMSDAVLLCSFNGKYFPHFIDTSLSSGKSLSVLRSALSSAVLRTLVREGCEAVDSFSSFLKNPSVIAYPEENGIYGIESLRFDIMRVHNG